MHGYESWLGVFGRILSHQQRLVGQSNPTRFRLGLGVGLDAELWPQLGLGWSQLGLLLMTWWTHMIWLRLGLYLGCFSSCCYILLGLRNRARVSMPVRTRGIAAQCTTVWSRNAWGRGLHTTGAGVWPYGVCTLIRACACVSTMSGYWYGYGQG